MLNYRIYSGPLAKILGSYFLHCLGCRPAHKHWKLCKPNFTQLWVYHHLIGIWYPRPLFAPAHACSLDGQKNPAHQHLISTTTVCTCTSTLISWVVGRCCVCSLELWIFIMSGLSAFSIIRFLTNRLLFGASQVTDQHGLSTHTSRFDDKAASG